MVETSPIEEAALDEVPEPVPEITPIQEPVIEEAPVILTKKKTRKVQQARDTVAQMPVQEIREQAHASADVMSADLEGSLASYGLKEDGYEEAAQVLAQMNAAEKSLDGLVSMQVLAQNDAENVTAADVANARRERIRLQNEIRGYTKRLAELGLKKPQENAEAVAALLKDRADVRTTQERLEEETLRDIEGRGTAHAEQQQVEDTFFAEAPSSKDVQILHELNLDGSDFGSLKQEYQKTYTEWEELRADLAGSDRASDVESLPTWEEFYAAETPQPQGFFQKLKRALFPAIPPRVSMWNRVAKARETLASGAAGISEGARARMKKNKDDFQRPPAQF
jgi:hypothetical protein